jgi:antitoxin component YwqK of YwqJK toxin-antitoxin module
MKRIILIFVSGLLLFNSNLSAQNKVDNKGQKQGVWSKTYSGGALMYEGAFKDDKPIGLFKHYYESGKLKIEQNYLSEDVSEVKMYENDGKTIAATGKYIGKKKDGEWKYYKEKRLVLTENFKNGKKEGISRVYSKSGAVMEEIPYKEDKITGIRKHFLEDGKIFSETPFKDGLEDGVYKLFEGNEKPVAEGLYVAGKKEGDWNFYDENGKIMETLKYKDGVLLNSKEQKREHSRTFDQNEKNQGKYMEPNDWLDRNSY